jgi:hypothetical protein
MQLPGASAIPAKPRCTCRQKIAKVTGHGLCPVFKQAFRGRESYRPCAAATGSIQGLGRPMVPPPPRFPTAFVITRGRCLGPLRTSYAPEFV